MYSKDVLYLPPFEKYIFSGHKKRTYNIRNNIIDFIQWK